MVSYAKLAPVFVVTGFLGSGKTTVLNHLLRHPSLKDAAVLVNEFGEVGLDHHLLQRLDENTVLLESGCVCCTIRGDLKKALLDLHDRRERGEVPPYRRVIIETTGLADPAPILFTLISDTVLRYHYRLGTVIATVDAVNAMRQLDQHPESVKQAAVADRILITKGDLVSPEQVAALRRRLRRLNHAAEIVEARFGAVDARRILRADIYATAAKRAEVKGWIEAVKRGEDAQAHAHDVNRHGERIHTFCLVFDRPIDWTAFGIWLTLLLHRHGENVLRVKGLLNVEGIDAPVVVQGVQHIVHPPMHLDLWPDDDRRSRIVFIVRDLPRQAIEASLSAFNRVGGVSPARPEAA